MATNNTNSHERSAFVSVRVVRGLGLWALIWPPSVRPAVRVGLRPRAKPEASLGDPWSNASCLYFRGPYGTGSVDGAMDVNPQGFTLRPKVRAV